MQVSEQPSSEMVLPSSHSSPSSTWSVPSPQAAFGVHSAEQPL
jgi:hypothetical protein